MSIITLQTAGASPDFMGFIWLVALISETLIVIVAFLVHEFWLLPAISKAFRRAKFSRGPIALIQDLAGNVIFLFTKKELPEGVIKTNHGWFLLPMPGTNLRDIPDILAARIARGKQNVSTEKIPCPECGSISKHRANCSKPPKPESNNMIGKVPDRPKPPVDNGSFWHRPNMKEYEKKMEEYADLYGRMVHVPILRGLGRQIFIGSITSPMLSNPFTIAHADLLEARKLLPMNMQKTQLDALETEAREEGKAMMGGDLMKWIFYVILAVIPIAVIGLVFWFLTQG